MWNENLNPDHAFTSWPSYKITFEKSAIFLIKWPRKDEKEDYLTFKPQTYWFYTEKLIYEREKSRDKLLAIKCKDSVGHFVRLVFWSFQINFMPEYKILSFCDIYHTKLKNLFCLMIYDITCESFKKTHSKPPTSCRTGMNETRRKRIAQSVLVHKVPYIFGTQWRLIIYRFMTNTTWNSHLFIDIWFIINRMRKSITFDDKTRRNFSFQIV